MASSHLLFPPFRFDVENSLLWSEAHLIPLRPKPLAVLRLLLEKRGEIVSREEIFRAVWPETGVSNGVLKVCIRELREALGDNAATPRFIETFPKVGYRFVAPLTTNQPVLNSEVGVRSPQSPVPSLQYLAPALVGREKELAQLQQWLGKATSGERQIIFVTGEPGIGKTALVDAFVTQARATSDV